MPEYWATEGDDVLLDQAVLSFCGTPLPLLG